MMIDDLQVVAEVTAAFRAYEAPLMGDEVPAMDALFHDAPSTVRYDIAEVLYGAAKIRAFRKGCGGSPQRWLGFSGGWRVVSAHVSFEEQRS